MCFTCVALILPVNFDLNLSDFESVTVSLCIQYSHIPDVFE